MSERGNGILGRLRLAGFTGAAGGVAAFLLALIILLVVAKPSRREPPGAVPRESPATVTAEIAELKKDPSAASGAAGALPRGARVTVLEDLGRWLKVRTWFELFPFYFAIVTSLKSGTELFSSARTASSEYFSSIRQLILISLVVMF